MSATVKVSVLLVTFFLVATLAEYGAPETEDPYSEFSDDLVPYHREERSRRSPDDKRKYEKEQYWNEDDVEVEEEPQDLKRPEEGPELVEPADEKPHGTIKLRKVRQVTYEAFDAAKQRPPTRYEVYEILDSEGMLPSESRPEKFVYNGQHYVRTPQAPADVQYLNDGHQHAVPGSIGSPPVTRYTQDLSPAETKKSSSASGGHHDHHAGHHSSHGGKGEKGHKSAHHYEKGSKGSKGSDKHAKSYNEHGGKKKGQYSEGGHGGEHHQAAHGSKGGKFDEKKGHNKGHNTKGYHNKYQKDEYHKEHKFYDDHHRSGSHMRYGDFNSKHGSNEGGSKKGSHHNSASHEDHSGKKGQHSSGHSGEDHKGHKAESGYEKQYGHHSDYGKKGGHQGGKSYGYQTKH